MGSHEKPPIPRVRVSSGAGAAGLSARNSPSGICSSVFSACMSAEPEGREGLYGGVFDCTEKVPGVNLHRKMLHPSSPSPSDGDRPEALRAPGGKATAFCPASSQIYFLDGVNLWRQNSHVRERNEGGQEPFVGKASALPLSVPQ